MKSHNNCGLCQIDIENLSVTNRGDKIIENINLTFHCGELTAVIGRNGAGKTTLLQAIINERPYSGSITFKSHDDTAIKKPKIGYVPQQLVFDKSTPVSVADFMLSCKSSRPLWLGADKKHLEEIKERLESLECGYLWDRPLGNLSGGEIQKVLLLTALDPMPDLLILDEPVSGVDAAGLDMFYKRITTIRDQYHIAIILVSHDLNLIRQYADSAVLIDKTVVAQGDVDEVFASEAFKQLFGYLREEK